MAGLEECRFSGRRFLDTPPDEADPERAGVFVISAPYDGTTSFKAGARYGPAAIIEASRHLEDYDLELDRDISEIGIYTAPALTPDVSGPEGMIANVKAAVGDAARRGKLTALLGGEHSVSVGAVQAFAEIYDDLSVLYLDAHADMRDCYMGSRWGHASAARRISDICPVTLAGVRSISAGGDAVCAGAGDSGAFSAGARRGYRGCYRGGAGEFVGECVCERGFGCDGSVCNGGCGDAGAEWVFVGGGYGAVKGGCGGAQCCGGLIWWS